MRVVGGDLSLTSCTMVFTSNVHGPYSNLPEIIFNEGLWVPAHEMNTMCREGSGD